MGLFRGISHLLESGGVLAGCNQYLITESLKILHTGKLSVGSFFSITAFCKCALNNVMANREAKKVKKKNKTRMEFSQLLLLWTAVRLFAVTMSATVTQIQNARGGRSRLFPL